MIELTHCTVDLDRRVVRSEAGETTLTEHESRLLRYLADHPGRPISREELLREVWEYAPRVVSRTVDATILRLRRKVERDAAAPDHIVSVYGHGYRFEGLAGTDAIADPHRATVEGLSFIGRQRELADVAIRLKSHRLITLTGPGGIGKTRLVTRFARLPGAPAKFVDASTALDGSDLARAVGRALEIPLGGPDVRDPIARIGTVLGTRGPLVLVLDNLEQVVADARTAVAVWLEKAPQIRILATSREALGLAGEDVLALDTLGDDDAVQLLCDRAAAARPGFTLPEAQKPAAVRLVRALDGLPLAIELAAARIAIMTVPQIVDRLCRRFDLLRDADAARPARHGTLRATIAWSWELLEPWEQRALAQASVFRGGFTLEAAEQVLQPGDGAPWIVDALQTLARKSLLRIGPNERFTLLESIREYAAEQLAPTDEAASRHADAISTTAEGLAHGLRHVRFDPDALAALADETDNLLAIPTRFPGSPVAVRAILALHPVLYANGPWTLHARLLDEAVRAGGGADALLARAELRVLSGSDDALADIEAIFAEPAATAVPFAYQVKGDALLGRGLYKEAIVAHRQANSLHRAANCRIGEATALHSVGLDATEAGELAVAEASLRKALVIHREIGHLRGEVITLDHLGVWSNRMGRAEDARASFEAAVERVAGLRDRRLEANVRTHLASAWIRLGRHSEAKAELERALVLHREANNRRFEFVALGSLGALDLADQALVQAEDRFHHALVLATEIGDEPNAASLSTNLGIVFMEQGRFDEAYERFTSAAAVFERLGRKRSMCVAQLDIAVVELERGRLDSAEEAWKLAAGGEIADPELKGLVYAFGGRIAAGRGDTSAADQRYGLAETVDVGIAPEVLGILRDGKHGVTVRTADVRAAMRIAR